MNTQNDSEVDPNAPETVEGGAGEDQVETGGEGGAEGEDGEDGED